MDLVKLIIVKYLLGFVIQDFLFVVGIHTFNNQRIEIKQFMMINAIFIPVTILVRVLPISFGIHTLLNVTFIFILTCFYFGFELYQTIRSTLITTVLILATELIGVNLLLALFGKEKINTLMLDPYTNAVIYLPINMLFACIILFFYVRMYRKQLNSSVN